MLSFTKHGLKASKWDGDSQGYVPTEFTSLAVLRENCIIEEGVTLGDIFEAVAADEPLKLFLGMYSSCPAIDEFHAEVKKPRTFEGDEDDALAYIQIQKCADFSGQRFDLSTWLSGISVNGHSYSTSFLPMSALAHLPVKLDQRLVLTRDNKQDHEIAATVSFSLLEVLDAIYDEISFYGGPDETKAFGDHLGELIAELKENPERTVPLDEVFGDV